jgi:hypothetical protein
MAENESEGSSSGPLNLNSVLALVTLAGGVWLVSHRLTSDRPMASGGVTRPFIGEQTLSARLWEDPFKTSDSDTTNDVDVDLAILIDQIKERTHSANQVLLLPVMLPGGQYSEDVESRIRGRYSIVSALGVSGFAPDDAEHLGAITLPWPSRRDVVAFQRPGPSRGLKRSSSMDLRFEWYRARTFFPPTNCPASSVLVLWLDDSFFEDAPLIRLPLVLEPFVHNVSNIALIGPRRSSTLRAMLPDFRSGIQPLAAKNPVLLEHSKEILGHVDLFCATPSAMDEALVQITNCPTPMQMVTNCPTPRQMVQYAITNGGFKSFHNYVATDAQLAGEVLDELKVDGIELTNSNNHLVLIYEEDTFYGRTLSLTYSAELASRQSGISRSAFVQALMTNGNSTPANFHSFVYLRGLDGQTVKSAQDSDTATNESSGSEDKQHPSSFEDIRNWTPDANKAEGQAQFDYLGRLGDQLEELQRDLNRSGRGKIRAIGVVGSDVYDTLLILQALHSQSFDRVIFFTTDLDARFLHPRENEWTRDLLVVSSYGLALHPDLQSGVAPFRESAQTAQFAATLAALGNTQLAQLKFISPRRFEIGKQVDIDWSTNMPIAAKAFSLHPLTPSQIYALYPSRHVLWRALEIGVPIFMFICLFWKPIRRVTFRGIDFLCEALDYTEEDIGSLERARTLLKKIHPGDKDDPSWGRGKLAQLDKRFAEESEKDMFVLLAFFNSSLAEEIDISINRKNGDWVYTEKPEIKGPLLIAKLKSWLNSAWMPWTRFKLRKKLDLMIDTLCESDAGKDAPSALQDELEAAKEARLSAHEIFRLRCWLIGFYWTTGLLFAVLGCRLGWLAWQDTVQLPKGEPFSLTNGVSAWPGEILRFLVVVFAVWFAFALFYRMRETYFKMSRKFRLGFKKEVDLSWRQVVRDVVALFLYHEAPRDYEVSISTLWKTHYGNGLLWRRLLRIAAPLALLCLVEKFLFVPEIVRGPTLAFWDPLLVRASGLGFLAVALLTIDSAMICRRFILALSSGPTDYNKATRALFSRDIENTDSECLEDWIDIQLVTELTEQVGKLVYYPTILLVLLLLARNGWWENWSWPPGYIFSFVCGLLLALASVWILQNAAKQSKQQAQEDLERKAAEAHAREEPPRSKASQAEKMLDELRNLKRGAFVPFWQNPVVTAFFASSGGITALQIGIWLLGR